MTSQQWFSQMTLYFQLAGHLLWWNLSFLLIILVLCHFFNEVQSSEINLHHFVHILLALPLPQTPSTLNEPCFFIQQSSSLYIICPCLHSLLSSTLHLIPFMHSFTLNTFVHCCSSMPTSYIQWRKLASFLPSLLKSSASKVHVSIPCWIEVLTQTSYNLLFTLEEKTFVASSEKRSLNFY